MTGGVSLTKACKESKVKTSTFRTWINNDNELLARYEKAHVNLVRKMANDIIDIADSPPETYIDQNGASKIDPASVSHRKLQIDSRKWLLSKVIPNKYGDSVNVNGNPDQPIKIEVTRKIVKSDETRD